MTIGTRIKILRNDLKMTQETFGKSLGVSRDVINNLERDRVDVKEAMIRLIAKTYRVNYFWLTEGDGEMYIGVPDIIIDDAIEKYQLNEEDKAIIEEYVRLDPEVRNAFKNYLRNVIKKTPG
ncbi:helix-turn-helix domain-containing protein [Enterocloster citroniae]|uniref:helix-turn-helix domain-containing protein n=1 Tax=Enterocloster citroniae TaxID=358743 RepID=UPI001D08C6DE|nr:helix-turn-helix transcriptional regulator [Enterocloster citroniae]MCB7064153.1 helix-turn-helix domain-containing protein [Enterocloster citroniae]